MFGNSKATSVITPEEYKAVEDQLNSKVRLLEETARQLEQTKRQCREVTEKLKLSQQKQDSLTIEINSLQQQLRVARQESTPGKPLSSSSPAGKSEDVTVNALKQQIAQLTTENKQLMALTQLQKNNTSLSNKDKDVTSLPRRHSSLKDVTALDTVTTTKTTTMKNSHKELWEQLRDVLIRPSSLVD